MLIQRAGLLCAASFTLGCVDVREPLGIEPPTGPMSHLTIGGQTVVKSGMGTATIDGILSPGEWANAAMVNFAVNVPGGGTSPATLYVLNDATNRYFAVSADAQGDAVMSNTWFRGGERRSLSTERGLHPGNGRCSDIRFAETDTKSMAQSHPNRNVRRARWPRV